MGLAKIESEVDAANARYSDLWLTEPTPRFIFISYYVPLPKIDADGLTRAWEGLQVVFDYVTQDDNFHIAAPMEFRFVHGGDTALAGTFTEDRGVTFINLDLVGFVEKNDSGPEARHYTPELLKFFAHVERRWVELGGLPHNGKMYGFYDPNFRPAVRHPSLQPELPPLHHREADRAQGADQGVQRIPQVLRSGRSLQ